jgi:hypothetical protein
MTLASGSRLGPYKIMSFVGAAEMGGVYRARPLVGGNLMNGLQIGWNRRVPSRVDDPAR